MISGLGVLAVFLKNMTDIKPDHIPKLYTIDQLKEVWYLGMLNGATLWQVCQDNTSDTKSSFEKVTSELKNTVTSEQSIKDIASSNFMLLGVACEVLNITELK